MATLTPQHRTLRDGRGVLIRAARASDAPALFSMLAGVMDEPRTTVVQSGELEDGAAGLARRITEHESHPGKVLLVALPAHLHQDAVPSESEVLGELSCACERRARIAHNCTFGISVAPHARSKGLGEAMVRVLIGWAREHPSIERINLGVFATNHRAIALYTRLGFLVEGTRRGFVRFGDADAIDDYSMVLFVKNLPMRAEVHRVGPPGAP